MTAITDLVKRGVRAFGFEVVTFPPVDSLGAHLVVLFTQLEINSVFDVGAHVGEYGVFLRGIGYKGHIISFEPVRANFAALERRCAHDPKWSALPFALRNWQGPMEINVTHSTEFSSVLVSNDFSRHQFGRRGEVERVEVVEVTRLESVFRECVAPIEDPRVYLKMDTQGCDLEVLEGAGMYLDHILALQSELSVIPVYAHMTGYVESISRMNHMGFELTGLFPVSRGRDLRIIELDCVMRRTSTLGKV